MRRTLNRSIPVALTVVLLLASGRVRGQEPRTFNDFGVMGLAKILCSAVFVSERDLEEGLRNSGSYLSVADRQQTHASQPSYVTGYDYGTGRNFARLGLLYLQDGVWSGERILPEGWADFVSTPAPGWEPPVYGGLFWVNTDGRWDAPESAYYMNGAGGQRVIIVPSHDLVVARQGHRRGAAVGMGALNVALGQLIAAIDEVR